MDVDVLVLGAVPNALRQELKESRALKKTTLFRATCSLRMKLIPSCAMGWVQVASAPCLSGDEALAFFQGCMLAKCSKGCPHVTSLEK